MSTIWLDAIEFEALGGWKKESQFVRSIGQSYLLASDFPGRPVENASSTFHVDAEGMYRLHVRTKNWKHPEAPGRFTMSVDGKELPNIMGKMPTHKWYWEIAGDVYLTAGTHSLEAVDKTGWLSRFADVVITDDMDFTPSPDVDRMLKQRAAAKGIKYTAEEFHFDFVVVGAGPGGMPAAVEAARNGLKVALVSGRPSIGGNSSKEGSISMDGASAQHRYSWEGGIANEIKNLHLIKGITYQETMEIICAAEPNLTVFTDELCIDADTDGDHIISATTVNTNTLNKKKFYAPLFSDCTGDGWLGYYAGAKYRIGREAKWQHNEDFAPDAPDTFTMSGCICDWAPEFPKKMRTFKARKLDHKVPFTAPDWAIKLPEGEALHRVAEDIDRSAWWMENSNDFDDLWDDEFVRDELVRLGLGYFHWLKNSAPLKPEWAAVIDYYEMYGLALHNSKRENRRLIGDYIFNQNDCVEGKTFPDAVSYCGWNIDVHHPRGMFSGKEGAFLSDKVIPITPLPYRMIYSKNIDNLFIGGRCCSVTHVGLGTVRVESTLATLGQAAGAAAYLCHKYNTDPRGIYENHIGELQQLLLRHDLTIFGIDNTDENDLARTAKVCADSTADDIYLMKLDGAKEAWLPIKNEIFTGPAYEHTPKAADYYKVELKNTSDKDVTIVAKLWHYEGFWDDLKSATEVERIYVTVKADSEGYVDLPFATKEIPSKFSVSIEPCDNILWRQRTWIKWSFLTYEKTAGGMVKLKDEARELLFCADQEVLADCSPENVINGKNRPTATAQNTWISNRKCGLPASITLTLAEPHDISEVLITTEADISYPTYAYREATMFTGMAQDLTVSILQSGKWIDVKRITDNVYKQMVVRFDKQNAEAVKITVTKSRNDIRAHITEVRIY